MDHPFVVEGYTIVRDLTHAFVHMIGSSEVVDSVLREARNGNLSRKDLETLFLYDLLPEEIAEVDYLEMHLIKNLELDMLDVYHSILVEREADLLRGDIIQEEWEDYRNTGTYIYDGDEIIELDDFPDDYGTLPKQFLGLSEFPIKYWEGRIVHNNWIHVDLSETTNWRGLFYRENTQKYGSKYVIFAQFDHQGITYELFIEEVDNFDDTEGLTSKVYEVAELKSKGVVTMWYDPYEEHTLSLELM